jgi:hypothetical protein
LSYEIVINVEVAFLFEVPLHQLLVKVEIKPGFGDKVLDIAIRVIVAKVAPDISVKLPLYIKLLPVLLPIPDLLLLPRVLGVLALVALGHVLLFEFTLAAGLLRPGLLEADLAYHHSVVEEFKLHPAGADSLVV